MPRVTMCFSGHFYLLLKHWLVISLAAMALSGCVSVSSKRPSRQAQLPVPDVYVAEFSAQPHLVDEQALFALNQKQAKAFKAYLNQPGNRKKPPHQNVANYLSKIIQEFHFQGDTLIAQNTLQQQQGNCLSLAILTTALSRVAGIKVEYELMQTPPIYDRQGNTILKSEHIRSVLHSPPTREVTTYSTFFRPLIKIDYFVIERSKVERKVSEAEFIAMYYRNKAGEALIDRDYSAAYWMIKESFKHAPGEPQGINMLALVYEGLGYFEQAEVLYRHGIQVAPDNLELMSNYYKYLETVHRDDEAAVLAQKIADSKQQNPFDWLSLGDDAFASGNTGQAIYYYEKVIKLAPYLHYGYFGLAKSELSKGNYRRAGKALRQAKKLANDEATANFYQAKLTAMSAMASSR